MFCTAKGFTVIELLSSLAVASVLVALGAPSLSFTLNRHKADGEVNEIVSMLALARGEAVKRSRVVTLCKSNNATACGGSWNDGWLLFVDNDRDGTRDASEEILRRGQVGMDFSLDYRAFGSSNYLRFAPIGLTLEQNGTFRLCPPDHDARFARAVIVSKLGRVRISQDANGDGIEEDASGNPLTCS